MAMSPLSNTNITPRNVKNTPNPVKPSPISAHIYHRIIKTQRDESKFWNFLHDSVMITSATIIKNQKQKTSKSREFLASIATNHGE